MSIKAQTILNQGDISIVAFNTTSPRSFAFVTWVPLAKDTEITFSESGFHSNAASTATGNIRWKRPWGIWKNTESGVIPAGTVITLTQEIENFGTFDIITAAGSSTATSLNILASGGHLFAYQGGSIPGDAGETSAENTTFNGKILFGFGYRGSGTATTWLTSGSAGSNYSWLPGNLTAGNHMYFSDVNLKYAQYNGVRAGKTLAEFKALVSSPANWDIKTDASTISITTTSFPVNAPTTTSVNHTGTLQVGQTLTGNYTYNDIDGNAENGSTFKWYRSDNASGLNKAVIASATAKTYTLGAADVNKHISFEVTPKDATEVVGTAVESALRGPVTAGVLPVQLVDFTVSLELGAVKLNWQTSLEQNNKGFEIYRSGNDNKFVKIGEVAGKETSSAINSYSVIDKQPLTGNNYYKLVQVDFDGKQTELGEKVISFNFSGAAVEVSPNPTEGKLTVRFNSGKYQVLTVAGLDGKVLQTLKLQPTSSIAEIDLTGYAKGIYFVKLSGNGISDVQKVVKK